MRSSPSHLARGLAIPDAAAAESDRGSVLVLMIGLVAVVVLLIGVVTDASVLFLTKRSLAAVVDGAALAGAQTLDEAAFYTGPDNPAEAGRVPLDARLSQAAVRDYLHRSAAAQSLDQLVLHQVQVSAEQVSVSATATADLPFRRFVGGGPGVRLQAVATAETPYR